MVFVIANTWSGIFLFPSIGIVNTKRITADFTISMSSNRIKKITYKDTLDNSVEIIFSNSVQDEPIDDNIFVFVAPSNYDLIRK